MSDGTSSYPGKVSSGDIYKAFRKGNQPVLSTSEIAQEIDHASRSTVWRKLTEMEENGELRKKKSGQKENAGVVWYPPEDLEEVPQPTPDILALIYTYPWFSLMVGGILSVGFAFLFFVPGFFGEGAYLGLIGRSWLLWTSFGLLVIGIVASYLGAFVIILKYTYSIIQN